MGNKNRSASGFGRYVLFILSFVNSPCSCFVFVNLIHKLLTLDFSIHWGSNVFFLWCGNIWIENICSSFNSDFFRAVEKSKRNETFRWNTSFLTFKIRMKRQTTKYYYCRFTEVAAVFKSKNVSLFLFNLPFSERAEVRFTVYFLKKKYKKNSP